MAERRQTSPARQPPTPLRISRTDSFARDFKALPKGIQKQAEEAILRLAENPSHPSLRTKKLKGTSRIWEASVTMSYRITYRRSGGVILLRRIGTHDTLKREML
ncbi:MAG: type II toxin-antitoxin system RelE/ParE family toxin [Terriglobia bacterium]